jgi:hypothetical protein
MQVSESVGNLTVAVLVDRARRLAPLAGVTGEHLQAVIDTERRQAGRTERPRQDTSMLNVASPIGRKSNQIARRLPHRRVTLVASGYSNSQF